MSAGAWRKISIVIPLAALFAAAAWADDAPTNPVAALEAKLETGAVKLTYSDAGHGYLQSLLDALNVSPESQVLPFTRSSLQFDHINPQAPRAVYFNDEVSVGAVHAGGVIEVIANDKRGGMTFWTLDVAKTDHPKLEEESQRCVACHGIVNTVAPGWIVANITATADGTPHFTDLAHPFDVTAP